MQIYDDKKNEAGMKILFMLLQMIFLLLVYAIVYTSYIVVGLTIVEKGGTAKMYIPVGLAMIIFPYLLYMYRKMFIRGRMLAASIWTISISSLTVALLYFYIAKISG